MKHVAVLGLLALIAAAAPATSPTLPASPAQILADTEASARSAESTATAAKAKAIQSFDATAVGRALLAAIAAREQSLVDARASGTPQDKLDASSAFNRARQDLDEARADAVAGSDECRLASAQAKAAALGADQAKTAFLKAAAEKAVAEAREANQAAAEKQERADARAARGVDGIKMEVAESLVRETKVQAEFLGFRLHLLDELAGGLRLYSLHGEDAADIGTAVVDADGNIVVVNVGGQVAERRKSAAK